MLISARLVVRGGCGSGMVVYDDGRGCVGSEDDRVVSDVLGVE